jgi:rhodanese-related sulfurtransferase
VKLTKGYKILIEEARAKIRTFSLQEAKLAYDNNSHLIIDIRDIREIDREGLIPGAIHVPRGMLEFWVDPESPYFKAELQSDKPFLLYCQSAWRSSLAAATLVDMGLTDTAHIEGGYRAWRAATLPTAPRAQR